MKTCKKCRKIVLARTDSITLIFFRGTYVGNCFVYVKNIWIITA